MSDGNVSDDNQMTFWGHLEVFRGALIRCVIGLVAVFTALFFFKKFLFDSVVLAPTKSDFWLYRLLGLDFSVSLINIEVTAQFFIHLRVTFIAALVVCFPYICYELWRFVAPALYRSERRVVRSSFLFGAVLFYLGAATGYFIVMPLIMIFFNGYQVSPFVQNTFSLSSYISIFSSMVLLMGILYEFPSVTAILSRLGVVSRGLLKKYRRHAIVVILVLSAILTPTGDPFTMLVVALPLYLLYEFSILICKDKVA